MSTKTHKPGTTTDLSSSTIKRVRGGSNPASKGSDRFRRFALMKTNMSVGDWYATCRNDPTVTGRAHSKLVKRAVAKGYITLATK